MHPQTHRTPEHPVRLLDQLRDRLRVKHQAIRTRTRYLDWIKRDILLHGKRHPNPMGAAKIEPFLTHWAVGRHVDHEGLLLNLCDFPVTRSMVHF